MAQMRMREALRDAMAEEMRRDEEVLVMGEDVAVFQGSFKVTEGLRVPGPSPPADGKGLLKAAIRDDNPVIFIEHETLYGVRGEVPENGDGVVNFGEAAIRREGGDVTIVGILRMVEVAMQAARTL